jgi:hypothetical protein
VSNKQPAVIPEDIHASGTELGLDERGLMNDPTQLREALLWASKVIGGLTAHPVIEMLLGGDEMYGHAYILAGVLHDLTCDKHGGFGSQLFTEEAVKTFAESRAAAKKADAERDAKDAYLEALGEITGITALND